MNLLPSPQQLRYLVALAESRHFGRAAHACSVTQSTLSAGLLALERQLDTNILDRDAGRHVVFTPLGLELVERARTALSALEAMTETVLAAREPMGGPLRMGVIPTIGPFLLPRLMPALRGAFPRLKLYLREDTTANLADRLNANRLDVLLLALPCDCAGAEAMPVARDAFMVALPPNHRLADEEQIAPAALATERLLLLEDGHCLRDQALAVCGLLAGDRGGDQDGFAATSQPAHPGADGGQRPGGDPAAAFGCCRRHCRGHWPRAAAAGRRGRLADAGTGLAPERTQVG
jgi:LysR family hydrogen peroxide-inducible transcriptional activator